MILLSIGALLLGFLLDLLIGDPPRFPHMVRGIGFLIAALEKPLRAAFPKTPGGERAAGTAMALCVLILCTGIPLVLLYLCYRLSQWAFFALETLLVFECLATKSLRDESGLVYASLAKGDTEQARRDVSMIVGRDTEGLDEAGIARAAVETVAENASDGCVAPLFYLMLGGGALGCFYKAVNTMDSMVGYKNERYLHFGRFAAKFDDVVNFLPSRLAALLMILGARLLGFDAHQAWLIWRRDRRNHASPNSAQTESVMAGALHVRLAGGAYYFGKWVEKPTIGDDIRPIEAYDIPRSHRLLYASAILMLLLALIVRGIFYAI